MLSKMERIQKVAPELKLLVQQHESDSYPGGGVEAFNAYINGLLDTNGLIDREVKHVSKICVHPANREGAGLVPIDVQDLLKKFAEKGYNPMLWEAFGARIPNGPVGASWVEKNIELIAASDGLLAPMDPDVVDVATGRGSHGSAALRLAEFGGRSIHPELADANGMVSKAKLIELQPSWEEPLKNGLLYKVIPGELELEVPGLLACLSRVGNASHDVFRVQTALQMCARIHSIIASKERIKGHGAIDLDQVARQACADSGGSDAFPSARKLVDFVLAWSGGKNAGILRDLEQFERSATVKRKLAAADLEMLSQADLLHAPRYISVSWFN